jgi:hypothetical protein
MIFDTNRYPHSINIVWMPIGILMVSHAVRGIIRGKFKNRGSIWTTRTDFPLLFWTEVVGSLTFGIVCVVVGGIYLGEQWLG